MGDRLGSLKLLMNFFTREKTTNDEVFDIQKSVNINVLKMKAIGTLRCQPKFKKSVQNSRNVEVAVCIGRFD